MNVGFRKRRVVAGASSRFPGTWDMHLLGIAKAAANWMWMVFRGRRVVAGASSRFSGTWDMHLLGIAQHEFRQALTGVVADVEPYVGMVRPTQDAKHGDYQANFAMPLAKLLGNKPRDVAQEIALRLPKESPLEPPEIAGPGFINVRFKTQWLAAMAGQVARDPRLGVAPVSRKKTFVIDFSSPNVAKPMHVGHLRSTIIGDALTRLLRFLGHTVITDNHLGDWGTQFGILLYGYKHFVDPATFESDRIRELARLYVLVRQQMKADEDDENAADAVAEACRQETAKLHAGDTENVRLWKLFMPACMAEIERIYRRLDVTFDHVLGESYYNPMLPVVVADLLAKGLAKRSEGAIAIFFAEKEPPALIQKRDGAFTYTTTDLATIRHRIEEWKADDLIYVVDSRQALHFKNLFAIARRWGHDKVGLEHVSFGSVLGDDRRPLKTREGNVPELGALLGEAVQRARDVYEAARNESLAAGEEVLDLAADELQAIAEAVGIGAVKYADLCQNRATDYVFSWPKMLAMNGNTAAYMQYAYVRNRGIFRKAEADVAMYRKTPPPVHLETPHERALVLQLLRFEETLHQAAAEFQPSVLTSYLWDLAKTYSGFFQNCPVLKAPTPLLKESRLLLCDLTARVLQQCLQLLGIRTVERM
jgi:arginyl-tRNA synthetase